MDHPTVPSQIEHTHPRRASLQQLSAISSRLSQRKIYTISVPLRCICSMVKLHPKQRTSNLCYVHAAFFSSPQAKHSLFCWWSVNLAQARPFFRRACPCWYSLIGSIQCGVYASACRVSTRLEAAQMFSCCRNQNWRPVDRKEAVTLVPLKARLPKWIHV